MATREITDSRTVIGVNALASRSLVVDRDLYAPPGSCADRANYLVASSAIGARWQNHRHQQLWSEIWSRHR